MPLLGVGLISSTLSLSVCCLATDTPPTALFLRAYSLERKVTRGPKGDVVPEGQLTPSGNVSQVDVEGGAPIADEKKVEPTA